MEFKRQNIIRLLALLIGFLGGRACYVMFHAENINNSQHKHQKVVEGSQLTHEEKQDHSFEALTEKIFYTPKERKRFFKQIGVEYHNDHIFEYEPTLESDAKKSEKYLEDIEANDLLSAQYVEDIANCRLAPMSIRWIDAQIGHGIFAEKKLKQGHFIGVYGGQVKDRLLVDSKDYAWSYPGKTLNSARITLDGAFKGNELRLINDGKDPNCVVEYIIGPNDLWYICYIASKDIKKGEQLLISYGPAYWESRDYAYQELAEM